MLILVMFFALVLLFMFGPNCVFAGGCQEGECLGWLEILGIFLVVFIVFICGRWGIFLAISILIFALSFSIFRYRESKAQLSVKINQIKQ